MTSECRTICVAQGQNEGRLEEDVWSAVERGSSQEEGRMVRMWYGNPRSTELSMIEEESYRMWEMNKQMSPSQPLLDLTTPAL